MALNCSGAQVETAAGRRTPVMAGGDVAGSRTSIDRALVSHEAACIFNASDTSAHVRLRFYFARRDAAASYLKNSEPVPRDTDYSSALHSDMAAVVQHTRLEPRYPQHVLLSTDAWAVPQ